MNTLRLVLAALLLTGCATAPRMNQLAVGMTKQQVVSIMGSPNSTAGGAGGVEILRWRLSPTGHDAYKAITDEYFVKLVNGTVEVDETYVGGKTKGMGRHYMGNKTPVVSLVERGGRVRSQVMSHVTSKNLKAVLKKHVAPSATIMTDNFRGYQRAAEGFRAHFAVNHSAGEYVRGLAHTNGVEGFFSLLKRGVVGTFHHISEQRLPLYLAEFDHRHNCRFVTDGERTVRGLRKIEGKRLFYCQPRN